MFIARLLSSTLKKVASIANSFAYKIDNSQNDNIQFKRCVPWFKDNGDKTLRLNYDLNQNSIVFDLGGYEGQWASDILNKYNANLFIFEPYLEYAKNIQSRFSKNVKVRVFPFGLSNENKRLTLNVSSDASSTFKKGDRAVTVELKKALEFFNNNNITQIALMKVNIEGGEYDLIEHLIEDGFIRNIQNIQVQFHDFVPNAHQRMSQIQQNLALTHQLTYQYEFVWENWRIKSQS